MPTLPIEQLKCHKPAVFQAIKIFNLAPNQACSLHKDPFLAYLLSKGVLKVPIEQLADVHSKPIKCGDLQRVIFKLDLSCLLAMLGHIALLKDIASLVEPV